MQKEKCTFLPRYLLPRLAGDRAGKLQQHGMEHATCPGAFTQEFPNWK